MECWLVKGETAAGGGEEGKGKRGSEERNGIWFLGGIEGGGGCFSRSSERILWLISSLPFFFFFLFFSRTTMFSLFFLLLLLLYLFFVRLLVVVYSIIKDLVLPSIAGGAPTAMNGMAFSSSSTALDSTFPMSRVTKSIDLVPIPLHTPNPPSMLPATPPPRPCSKKKQQYSYS
ncbi:hypothetical protein QBC41DRAFT_70493 [Cercophora samala]|uniref:Uncharacterized protein n=1 Tax=Cercophora samala TaxID=330535 RepID=A0AA40DEG3_9PEZI|nr:hypothetical protein QBC41DRAFT_70493 [Cercophora samala]